MDHRMPMSEARQVPRLVLRRSAMRPLLAALLGLGLAASALGCNVGPDYQRPPVATPATFRGLPPADGAPSAASLADERWWALFDDATLRGLIAVALERNADVHIAAARVLEAESQLGITRADQLPTLAGQASVQGNRTFSSDAPAPASQSLSVGLAASWELDFWGKFRRASEAARAQLLGSEWGRCATRTTLVSQVASAYFILRALDQQHAVAERTLQARRESLRLIERREQSGIGSLLDVRQAEELVHAADGERIDLARRIEQHENLISTLLGADPGPVARGQTLDAQTLPPELPAGLPSALLERRPDIRVAEAELIAQNARIGVAKADYFPQLTLTGSGGVLSNALGALFSAPALALGATGSLVQPLFNGGRIDAAVSAAEAREQQALFVYRRTILQALREVSDSLIGVRRNRELRGTREALLGAAREARTLADARYQGGSSSYLDVLDSDTRLLGAEFSLVQARLDELLSIVELYRALGGGWQV